MDKIKEDEGWDRRTNSNSEVIFYKGQKNHTVGKQGGKF
jgi:hypothetical protein